MRREQEEETAISSARSYAAKMDLLAMTLKSLHCSKLLQTHLYSSNTVALAKKRDKTAMVSNPP